MNITKPADADRFQHLDSTKTGVDQSRQTRDGSDIKLIQQIAGHSNPLITLERYSHLLDQRLTDAAARFDPAEKHLHPR